MISTFKQSEESWYSVRYRWMRPASPGSSSCCMDRFRETVFKPGAWPLLRNLQISSSTIQVSSPIMPFFSARGMNTLGEMGLPS